MKTKQFCLNYKSLCGAMAEAVALHFYFRLFLCFSRQAGEQKYELDLGAINGLAHSRHRRNGAFSSVSMKLNISFIFSISE